MRDGRMAGWQGELNEKRNGLFVRPLRGKFKENCPRDTRGQKVISGAAADAALEG